MPNYVRDLADLSHEGRADLIRAFGLGARLLRETTVAGGVIRWRADGRVLDPDAVLLAVHLGLPVTVAQCDAARLVRAELRRRGGES